MNENLLNIINSRQLVSVMNNTKWRELCEEFEKLQHLNLKVRYKLITTDQLLGFSPVWWRELFEHASQIEWLEFDPIVTEHRGQLITHKEINKSVEILNVLQKHSIRYSKEQSYFRVWGYITSTSIPEFI
jgi:hypothetical protein